MSKRPEVPPMRVGGTRPRDVLLEPASAPSAPAHIKTSVYLRPDQIALLDARRAAHRAAGRRTVSASDLMRAAIDLALSYDDEWDAVVAEEAR